MKTEILINTPMDQWIKGPSIGHGSFAKVNLAKPTNQSSRFPPLMAIKSSAVSNSTSLMNEFVILNELKGCPEIVTCYGDCFTVENGEKLYNIALEYASGGSLAEKVKRSEDSKLSESDVRRYAKSILKGLQFVHRKGFVHCDIKLENILLFSGDEVKIIDFGLSKKAVAVEEEEDYTSKCGIRGTPMYMSPEMVVGGEQGPASDVWAVGCVVSEMMTGEPVWGCSGIGELLMKIGVGANVPDIPGTLSHAGKDFVRKCFVRDASERWTADMLLNHPFIVCEDQVSFGQKTDKKTYSVNLTYSKAIYKVCNQLRSDSPKNPFDFRDWESERSHTVTPFGSLESESRTIVERGMGVASRLRQLVTEGPDWSVTSSWVTVR